MFVLGLGIGGVMQVLVIAVQNAVEYRDLGAATSGATFFRSIGGSFGTAVFGTVFANVLAGNLASRLAGHALPPGTSATAISPDLVSRLPEAVRGPFLHAYADSLDTVFLAAAPVALVAFLLTWLLPELELRRTTGATDPGETFAMPADRTSLQEVERAVTVLATREERPAMYRRLAARAGLALDPRETWLLYRVDDHPGSNVGDVAGRAGVEPARLEPAVRSLCGRGYLVADGECVLTPAGRAAVARLTAARRDGLADLLAGWRPEEHPELRERLRSLARELLADDERILEEARSVGAVKTG
jgi:DNA-binding MarR family transcriptional regulator